MTQLLPSCTNRPHGIGFKPETFRDHEGALLAKYDFFAQTFVKSPVAPTSPAPQGAISVVLLLRSCSEVTRIDAPESPVVAFMENVGPRFHRGSATSPDVSQRRGLTCFIAQIGAA